MEGSDDAVLFIIESQGDEKVFRRNWARLIQKICEVNPLICPKCQGIMRIISFIENRQIIRAILDHLGIWLVRERPPPKIIDPAIREYVAVDLHLQTHSDDFEEFYHTCGQFLMQPAMIGLLLFSGAVSVMPIRYYPAAGREVGAASLFFLEAKAQPQRDF